MIAIGQPIFCLAHEYRDGFLGDALQAWKFRAHCIRRAWRTIVIEVEKIQWHSMTLTIWTLLVCFDNDSSNSEFGCRQIYIVGTISG
jgi:hypothetical protein